MGQIKHTEARRHFRQTVTELCASAFVMYVFPILFVRQFRYLPYKTRKTYSETMLRIKLSKNVAN